ncbi:hypothetical protein NQ318_016306 [Aromia moschata]|uniref:Uncharacterized protein n=1 Tax=Aromia moschata TaxID=1265417 RepID=A0AAV8Z3R1_9CUCU|nr:hypothetical protein NQ318_016306 [Aromia moschata]
MARGKATFGALQTDVNPNHLQMALALSKSTYNDENPGTFEDLEDLPTFLSQEKIAKVKTTLERYGFRSNKPKVNIEVPKRSRVSDFRFFAPILQTRKDEERETLIASKVSLILQQTNSDTTELQTRQNKNEVVSGVLKKFCRDEIPVFAASGLNLEETIKFSYYSKNLNITPNRGNCGCLLRKWDDIPGREKTPERYEQRSIKNASNQFRTWQTIKDISQEHQIKHNNSNTLTNLAEENLSTRNNCVSPDLFDSDDEFNCSPKTLQSEVILSQPLLNLSPLNRQDLFRSRSSKIVNDSEPKKLKISNCEIFKSENGILHFESYNSDFENLSEDAYIITQCLEEKNTEILDLTKDLKKDEIELYGLTKPVDVSPKYRIGILNQNQRYDLNNETANEKTVTLRMDLDNYDKNFPEKESVIIQCLKSPKEMDLGLLKTYEIDNEAEVYDLTQSSPDEISDTESKDLLDLYEKHDMSNKTPKEKSVMKEADTDFDMTPLCIQNSSGALVANSARLETQSFCNVSEQNDDLCNMSYSSNCNRDGIYCFGSSKWLNVTDYVNQILTDEVITNQDYAEELNLCQVGGINLSQVSSSQDSIVISDEELNYSSIQSKILKNKYGKQESSGLVHNRITQLKNASITRESLVNAFLEESFNASCEDKGNAFKLSSAPAMGLTYYHAYVTHGMLGTVNVLRMDGQEILYNFEHF